MRRSSMTIDEVSYGTDAFVFLTVREEFPQQVSNDDIRHRVAIQAFRVGSYLTEPICKAHELYRRISIVDVLHPESNPLENAARKISICLMMLGWFALSVVTTLPGIALRYLGQHLQKTPYVHMQEATEKKILPADRSFSLLSWNICCVNAGFSITDAGVMHWSYRIDDIIKKVAEKDADVNCLTEVFDINTAYYLCEKLKTKGYSDFYFNIGANPIGISSGIFIASKYSIKNPEFTRFPLHSLVGRTKAAAKGVFAFDLESQGEHFVRVHSTHLQHSEEPEFPTVEEVEARRIQMQIIIDKVNGVRDRCAILTGDLNLDDEEYKRCFWQHLFERMDFGDSDKTWGGDAFCSSIVERLLISGPLNLDYTLITPGTAHPVENSLVITGFDGTEFKKEALSDHAGLFSRFAF